MFWLIAFLEYKQFLNGYFSKLFFIAVSFNTWLCKENGKIFQNECILRSTFPLCLISRSRGYVNKMNYLWKQKFILTKGVNFQTSKSDSRPRVVTFRTPYLPITDGLVYLVRSTLHFYGYSFYKFTFRT